MLDVVGNHMGNQEGSHDDYRQFTPFNDAVRFVFACVEQSIDKYKYIYADVISLVLNAHA